MKSTMQQSGNVSYHRTVFFSDGRSSSNKNGLGIHVRPVRLQVSDHQAGNLFGQC